MILDQAREALMIESQAIAEMAARLDQRFEQAVKILLGCTGRVALSGIGKSGAIARKIASTLASTGTPALFLPPVEAMHGDLGMITEEDVVILLSNSGESREVLDLLPFLKRRGCRIIAFTGQADSTLALEADITLDTGVRREACALNLAPTASTACQLAMGDALAVTLMRARGFTEEDWLTYHPAGALGRRLLLRVEDIMHGTDENPTVSETDTVRKALELMTTGAVRGMVNVVDASGKLTGFLTDGDVRVQLVRSKPNENLADRRVGEIMTRDPTVVHRRTLAAEALKILQNETFDNLPVVDEDGRAVGVLDIQDLVEAGII